MNPDFEIVFYIVSSIIVLLLLFKGCFLVEQQTNAIVERFGKFNCICTPGLNIIVPFVDRVTARISLRIRQLDVLVETKTLDNVFVKLRISVQFQVLQKSVYDAHYKLDYPEKQINAYIFDVVRAEIPKMNLDDVFVKKDEVAIAIRSELHDAMQRYGYDIVKALVTDIDPDPDVKTAMNRINAAERNRKAAEYEGEAEKIKTVKKAEAESESKKLQGKGIADQRREIARGLEDSIKLLGGVGVESREASALIIVTQHYDSLQAIGGNNRSNLILMPSSPDAATQMLVNMTASFAAAGQTVNTAKASGKEDDGAAPSGIGLFR